MDDKWRFRFRTSSQHEWAEASEKLFDIDPDIKYGGGDPDIKTVLLEMSQFYELLEDYREQRRISNELMSGLEPDKRAAREEERNAESQAHFQGMIARIRAAIAAYSRVKNRLQK